MAGHDLDRIDDLVAQLWVPRLALVHRNQALARLDQFGCIPYAGGPAKALFGSRYGAGERPVRLSVDAVLHRSQHRQIRFKAGATGKNQDRKDCTDCAH